MQPCQYIFALRAHHVHYSLKEEIQYLLPNRMVIFFENFITEQDWISDSEYEVPETWYCKWKIMSQKYLVSYIPEVCNFLYLLPQFSGRSISALPMEDTG
jgi:hypothetical protein